MGVETAIIAAIAAATITAGAAVAVGAIQSETQKDISKRTLKAQSSAQSDYNKVEEERYQTQLVEEARIAEENKQREANLIAAQGKQLKIEAQQFHIATLADLLKTGTPPVPIYMQTASAKTETGIIGQINNWLGTFFRR